MDPVSMSLMTMGSTLIGGVGSALQMNAEAKAGKQRAEIEGKWNERRALEERASAQSEAADERRQAILAQSRLGAIAGASGSGVSDPTVMQLWKGIEQEGALNSGKAMAGGQQRATGLDYQTSLDRWTAGTNARIKRAGAVSTLVGSFMGAGGDFMKSRMSMRYPGARSSSFSTGYGN